MENDCLDKKILSGVVEKLVYGGHGLVRSQGMVYFVPDVLPQEEISFTVRDKKASFSWADLVHIHTTNPLRVKPHCSYVGACGGCQLQHSPYPLQLEFKKQWIVESLERLGGIKVQSTIEMVGAKEIWGYRRRIQLHLREKQGHYEMGYIHRDNISLVCIDHCPIFDDSANPIFSQLRNLIRQWKAPKQSSGSIQIIKLEANHYALNFDLPKSLVNQEIMKNLEETFNKNILWDALTVKVGEKLTEWSKRPLELLCQGLICRIFPTVFLQNHPTQSVQIYQDITHSAQALPKGESILDLYCGIGLLSQMIAREGYCVTGIEISQKSIECAQQSAQLNQILGLNFVAGPVEKRIDRVMQHVNASYWVINPPRTGITQAMQEKIASYQPKQLVYISCNPTTLARDLKQMCKLGYHIRKCRGYDMFPQTTHVEVGVWLELP